MKTMQLSKIKNSKNKIARNLQIIGRILAGLDTLGGLFVLGTFLVITLMWTENLLSLLFILPISTAILSYYICLRNELIGGFLLIIEGIGFVIFLWIAHWLERSPFVTLLVSIPFIISGFLFIMAWYIEKYR